MNQRNRQALAGRSLEMRLRFVKGVIWAGIAADALWAVALLVPPVYGFLTGDPGFSPNLDTRLALGVAGSLMTGWTLLLVWTLRQPVARRGVLLLTAGVAFGMHIVATIAYLNAPTGSLWISAKTLLLVIGMGVGYRLAGSGNHPNANGYDPEKVSTGRKPNRHLRGENRWMEPNDINRQSLPPFPACSF